jgi:trigger factor
MGGDTLRPDSGRRKDIVLKIDTQPNDDCTLTLTVEVSEERLKPALEAAARQLSKRYPLPGFRPGKAPLPNVLRQFGEQAVYETALDSLGQKVYEEALDQAKIEAYGPGALDDMQLKPMVLKFTVPLKPEVEMGDYRALRLPYTAPAVSEEEINRVMESLRERQAVLEPVEREAALGDVTTLDVSGFLNEGLNPSDFLLADKDVSLQLDEKADWPMPGFAAQAVGLKAGETRKFDLAFPDDYANDSLKGQVAHFEVSCKEVKSRSLPEWNDDLAKEIGEFQTLDELKARVRDDLQKQAERSAEREYADAALDKLLEQTTIKYPPVVLEQEIDDLMDDLDDRLREQRLTLDDYLKIENKTREQVREEFRPRAEERLKRALVLGRIVEHEKLDVSSDEVSGEIGRLSAAWGERSSEVRKALSTDNSRRSLTVDLLTNKAVQRLIAIARGDTLEAPASEASVTETPTEAAPEAASAEASASS